MDEIIGTCPKCGEKAVEIDYCEGFEEGKPWEIACYACGWFVYRRFATREEAENYQFHEKCEAEKPVTHEVTQ